MRAAAVALAVLLVGCTPPADVPAGPTPAPTATAAAPGVPGASDLPAADPPRPSLREFAGVAEEACAAAVSHLAGARLRQDPFTRRARRADVAAAEVHYRAAARAWTEMAETLWSFGLPRSGKAQRLITHLDTAGQYSNEAAEAFAGQDLEAAQGWVKAAGQSLRKAERVAGTIGVGPLQDCGQPRASLPDARRVVVRATDFSFRVPSLRRGPTRFQLRNDGDEDHQLFVVPLRQEGTLQQAIEADRRGDPPGRFLAGAGKATAIVGPGGRAAVDIRLRRGPYALLCFVASPDDTPHAYKGMATETGVP